MANRLLNYTTKVEAEYSLDEIRRMLRQAGAAGISEQIEPATRKTIGISFRIQTPGGEGEFLLPVRVEQAYKVMEKQGTLPYKPRYLTNSTKRAQEARDVEARNKVQAERVAWRIIRDWLEAQLALIQVGMVELSEIMLPYMLVEDGKTLYQMSVDNGMFALPKPQD